MMYELVVIKDKEYKLCLPMMQMIDLEKKLGENPLNKLMAMADGNKLPEMDFILDVIHYSLKKYQPKTSRDEAANFIDEYFEEEENDLTTLIELMFSIFNKSGFFKMNQVEMKVKKK